MAHNEFQLLHRGITEDDLIHIVITGDTSQSPLGSSYKASLGEVKDLFAKRSCVI
jgi:hypothetical protein